MLAGKPYQYTSDDVLFECFAQKNDISESERKSARTEFFSKGQPCLRSSALAKRYGFGFHFDDQSKWHVRVLDTWNMTIDDRGTFTGKFKVTLPAKPYMAVQIWREGAEVHLK